MKAYEEIIGEAVRIELEENTGKLYIVFEIKNEKVKKDIKENWTDDIEYKIIDKNLMLLKDDE
jgi:hypothetical protein